MSASKGFWDRRRAGVQREAEAEAAEVLAVQEQAEQQALAERSDEEILAELNLPDPDTLKQGDDFAAYLARAVPERIRQRALRRLWRSNPVLACVDGLNDYDDDYLTGSYGNAPVKTSYQVGRGLMAHLLEMQRQEDVAAAPGATLDKSENLDDDDAETEDVALMLDLSDQEADLAQDIATQTSADSVEAEPVENVPQPRRMAFYFDEDV